jgi:hypothetical protein
VTTWVTRQQSEVLVEPCEDGHVIHLVASGMTHLVDPIAAALLTYLQVPREAEQVRVFLAEATADPLLACETAETTHLAPLEAIGLVERRS